MHGYNENKGAFELPIQLRRYDMKKTRVAAIFMVFVMVFALVPVAAFASAHLHRDQQGEMHYYGDATQDGELNTGDATAILKSCAELIEFGEELTTPTHEGFMIVDANKDGALNTADAAFILRVCVALETANVYYDMVAGTFKVMYTSGLPTEANAMIPENVQVTEGETFTLSTAADAEGYTFIGWSTLDLDATDMTSSDMNASDTTSSDATDVIYKVGDSFIMPAHDVTFYARWEGVEPVLPTPDESEQPTDPNPTEPLPTPDYDYIDFTVTYYDVFNKESVGTGTLHLMEGTNTLNASNITLPEGYALNNANYSATVTVSNGTPNPSTLRIEVYPAVTVDNVTYKVVKNSQAFNSINSNLDGNYMLGSDIDLGGTLRMPFGWDWENAQNEDTDFTGVFDGNGYTISGIYIDYAVAMSNDDGYYYSNVGLFAHNAGTIRNAVFITKPFDNQTYQYGVFGDANVGVVAGSNSGTISDCYVYGNVGSLDVEMDRGGAGGICGSNSGTVTRCRFEGGVEGLYWIGGLIGKNFGTLSESYFAGGINSAVDYETAYYLSIRYIGGLCGGAQNADIDDCYVYCSNTILGDRAVGGMVGWISGGTMHNSYIVNTQIEITTEGGGGVAVGYVASQPTYSGLYGTTNMVIGDALPEGFSSEVWDMNGACYSQMPDLIKNRRPEIFTVDMD